MEPIEFTTPGQYKVLIKPYLTYGEYKQIKQSIKDHIMVELSASGKAEDIKAEDVKFQPISLASILSSNDIALKILVKKVADKDGKDLGDPTQAIDNMPIEDADAVVEKVNEITKAAELSKKKGI